MRFCTALGLLVSCLCATAEDRPPKEKTTVVVTGTASAIPLEEADRNIRSIDAEALRPVSNTIADFLKLDSSVDLRQRGTNAIQGDVSIRGGSFGQTLILLDGLRLNDAQSGHHNFNVPVPIETIQQVEILKGSGSTLYGSDAIGGVINFITRRPENTELRLRGGLGNFGVNQEQAVASYSSNRFSQILNASRDFSTGFREGRDYRNLAFSSMTNYRSALGWSNITLAHNDRPFGADQYYGNANSWEHIKSWFASMRQEIGTKTDASFAFRRHTDLFAYHRYSADPNAFTNRHAVESYQAAVRRREEFGANARLLYGVETYRDSIQSTNQGAHQRTRSAGYAAFDLRAFRRFSLTAGVRDEVWGSNNHTFSPSFGGGYWLASTLKLRGSISRAFRLPSYTELYYHDPSNIGSPFLQPEKAWSYEAGADWIPNETLRGSVTVFHRREQNGIDYVRASPADIWRATNFQSLQFTGVEAVMLKKLKRSQQIEFSYTGIRGAQAAVGNLQSKYIFNYPQHQGIASWQASFSNGLIMRTRIGALQRIGRDPYAVWDAYGAFNRGRVRPFLQFTNLTAARYEEIPGIVMPGRAVVGGVEIVAFSRKN